MKSDIIHFFFFFFCLISYQYLISMLDPVSTVFVFTNQAKNRTRSNCKKRHSELNCVHRVKRWWTTTPKCVNCRHEHSVRTTKQHIKCTTRFCSQWSASTSILMCGCFPFCLALQLNHARHWPQQVARARTPTTQPSTAPPSPPCSRPRHLVCLAPRLLLSWCLWESWSSLAARVCSLPNSFL